MSVSDILTATQITENQPMLCKSSIGSDKQLLTKSETRFPSTNSSKEKTERRFIDL